jgi:NitT/TauT family transport system substrate-binding protein
MTDDRSGFSRRSMLAMTGVALAAGAAPLRAGAQTKTVLRVASTVDDSVTPILYGLQAGTFAKAGLDVQLQKAASGAALMAGVTGGSLEIGKSSPLSLIAAHARGIPIRILEGSSLYLTESPITAMIVLKNSPIKTAADLNGKVLSVPALKTLDHIAAQSWVDENGGNSATLKFVELPQTAVVSAALLQGRVDAATLVIPTLAEALASGNFRVLGHPFDSIGKRFLIAVWFSMRDWAQKNPDTIAQYHKAFAEAATYTNAHHAETVAMLAAYSQASAEVIRAMTRATTAVNLDPKDLQPAIDAAAKYNLIDKPFPAEELIG